MRVRSIGVRLTASLLAVLLLATLALGGFTYRNVLDEVERLSDYHLRQMALSLRDQGEIAPGEAGALADEQLDFVVQIWTADGRTVYASRRHSELPARALMGFADIEAGGLAWRTYGVAERGRVIQIAQLQLVRRGLAAQAALRSVVPLLLLAPLLALVVWAVVARSIAPLKRLARELRARDGGSLAPLDATDVPDEAAPLVRSLNLLLERLAAAFDAQRAFVADAAHELRSPLTALRLQIGTLRRAPDEATRSAAFDALAAGVDRASRLVEQLLTLARSSADAPVPVFEAIDLGELVREALADATPFAASRGTTIELEATPDVTVQGDRQALIALARNLTDNAVRHSPPGARVQVRVARDGAVGLLTIDDSGPGLAPQERARAFDRFWRREPGAAVGSGLGLAIVEGVAQRHNATVALGESALGGLRAAVHFAPG